MSQTTLGRNGEIMLPADVRQALGLKPGDTVRFEISDTGEVTLISGRTLARSMRTDLPPDRPTPHGARAPIEFQVEDGASRRGAGARGVEALRRGAGKTD